jgi:transcriptional regulator with XRE-family HTH domain
MTSRFSLEHNEHFVTALKTQRKKNNLTQQELAELARIDYKHVQSLESYKKLKDPRISTLFKLSQAFAIPVSSLVATIFEEDYQSKQIN